MFVESMILHAQAEAQREAQQRQHQPELMMENAPKAEQNADEQPNATVAKTAQMQQSQTQRQQQGQDVPQPRRQFVDPLGRPLYQGNPRFTDQQLGGDLSGHELDARDDNFVVTGHGQSARDISAHAEQVPPASAEAQRYMAVTKAATPAATGSSDAAVQPDGTEDPGANADDGLLPRQHDGSGGSDSERH